MDNSKLKTAYASSKTFYDAVLTQSNWWSRLYSRLFWGGVNDSEIAGKVLAMIPGDFAGKLLDVPVGTGVFTAGKYQALPNAAITCIDYSADMLLQAKERFAAHSLTHVTCLQGDVGALPFGDETFDIVLSMNGFHAFADTDKAYRETARVLKKGGSFCGCFYCKGQCRRTDFIVNFFLAKRGWFTPPFQTLAGIRQALAAMYTRVELDNRKAMVYFHCIK